MLITIEEFRNRVANDSGGLVSRLQEETGRYGTDEADAWRSCFTKLSQAFDKPLLQHLHLYFQGRGNVALEYQLPASSSWADVVLLGSREEKPSAVIIELKDWLTRCDTPGSYDLQQKLDWLWECRNREHLFLIQGREYGHYTLEHYNEAIGTFRALRKALDRYFADLAGVERS